jgi:hypothetical protein
MARYVESIRNSVFDADVNADHRGLGRDPRDEGNERTLRLQLVYRLGGGIK